MSPIDSSDNHDRDVTIIIGSILGALSLGLTILLGLLLIQRRRYAENARGDVAMRHCRRKSSEIQQQADSQRHVYCDEGEHCDDMVTKPSSVFKGSLRGIVKSMSGGKAIYHTEKSEKNHGLISTSRPRLDCDTGSAEGYDEGFDVRLAPVRRSDTAGATSDPHPHHMVLVSSKRMGSIFPDDLVISQLNPLAAHPTKAAGTTVKNLVAAERIGSQHNIMDEGSTKARRVLTDRRSLDKHRADQDDVLLGSDSLDLWNESSACLLRRDVELYYDRQHVEDPNGVGEQSNKSAGQAGEASQTSQPPQTIFRPETSLSRTDIASAWVSQPLRVNIPSSSVLDSIGLKGGENDTARYVSPETESSSPAHERDQLHGAVSPIIPDRDTSRRYSRMSNQDHLQCSPNSNEEIQQQTTTNTMQRLQIPELKQVSTTTPTTHNLQFVPTPKPIKRKPIPSQSKPTLPSHKSVTIGNSIPQQRNKERQMVGHEHEQRLQENPR